MPRPCLCRELTALLHRGVEDGHPAGPGEDGMRLVSTRGSPLMGSGKSFTPCSRMHWANSRACSCFSALLLPPMNPGGCRSLHALMAFLNVAVLVSSDEPFAIASMVSSPDASGSGNAATPLLAHALGELHRPLSDGVLGTRAAGAALVGSSARSSPRRSRRRWPGRPGAGARFSLVHPWVLCRVGVHGRATVIAGLGAQFEVPWLVAIDLAQPVRGAVL